MNIAKLCLLAVACILGPRITNAQTADEIVQKHLTAIGGADNWKKIKTLTETGSISAGGTELPVKITTVHGKGQKVEFTLNGMTAYQILTTTEGWGYSPMTGQTKPEAMPAEAVKEAQDELDVQGPLIDYKAKGNTVTYLGKDQVEGTECYKLKVVYANGKEETMFIDAATCYLIRTVEKSKANGQEAEQTTNYSNYTKLPEGIVFAMTVEDEGGPVTFKTIDINKPVDENIFKPTETKK